MPSHHGLNDLPMYLLLSDEDQFRRCLEDLSEFDETGVGHCVLQHHHFAKDFFAATLALATLPDHFGRHRLPGPYVHAFPHNCELPPATEKGAALIWTTKESPMTISTPPFIWFFKRIT